MSETRNLRWGEKHLCNDLFTIKISLGLDMYNSTVTKFKTLGLTVIQLAFSKKSLKHRYMVYGVLNQHDFQKYLVIKNKAQAKLLINKAAELLQDIKTRKEVIKHNEKIEGGRLIEPITLD